ncbi:hypothetical protein Tco_0156387 [Tanacetum coccineum]
MQAIKNIFGGNAATKKTQKNLLKQQYENFAASSIEVIEQTYERFQKLNSSTGGAMVEVSSRIQQSEANQVKYCHADYEGKKIPEEYWKEAGYAIKERMGFGQVDMWSVLTAISRGPLQGSARTRNQDRGTREPLEGVPNAVVNTARPKAVLCGVKGNKENAVKASTYFKLTDESQVLLKVPRKDNMYSVDLKNVVPQGGIENLIDLRVKEIRCVGENNGTEFRRITNQFCEIMGTLEDLVLLGLHNKME